MAKIGRNDPCPCASGRKYKHCCPGRNQEGKATDQAQQVRVSLMAGIERIQQAAVDYRQQVNELGVFVFFSTTGGDAWLLEMTDSDAVQVARSGKPLEVPIEENPETIEINWSHTFAIRNRQLFLTAYADQAEGLLDGVPVKEIHAALRRIRKRFAPELLQQVHIRAQSESPSV